MKIESRKIAAAGVHLYTALGLPVALWAALALGNHDARQFLTALWLAVFVDATDGFMARRLDVKRALPHFNGRRLDDIIDFLTFVFLPAVGLIEFGVLPGGLAWIAAFPLLASAYGFSRDQAKTEESFVGFPSYWNIVFLYLYMLLPPAWLVVSILLMLSALVLVPSRYVYPSRTKWLRPVTLNLGWIYALTTAAICLFPQAWWAKTVTQISLFYPLYYVLVSMMHHRRTCA